MTERSRATSTYDSLQEEMREAVEHEMRTVLSAQNLSTFQPSNTSLRSAQALPTLHNMLHYHIGWVDAEGRPVEKSGGKRIRPLLCLLSCLAAVGDWRRALPAAAAVELLHNFSLIHDDIEDSSPTRHGRPTVWRLWGVPLAINTGDALFAFAHLALHRLTERHVAPASGEAVASAPALDSDIVVDALRRFEETCVRLTQGQHADMLFEKQDDVTVEAYIDMITGKTATLLALSAELGALIGSSEWKVMSDEGRLRQATHHSSLITHYSLFGRDLGLAFQVRDDILGIWGDEALIGKSAATDIETRKKTLPVLYGLEHSQQLQALYARSENGSDFVERVVEELDRIGARAYAEKREASYSESALGHLEAAEPVEPGYSALRHLALQLLRREQ